MNALLCCLHWTRTSRSPRPQPRRHADDAVLLDIDEPLPGCGWFDSSWELMQGLAVTECGDEAPLPHDLPLAGLLQ